MIKKNPFEAYIKMLNAMTPEYKRKLVDAHRRFGELRSLCEAKGYIETMPQLRGIKVLKNKPEVKELKGVIDTLKPAKFIWEDIKTTGQSLKKPLAGSLPKKK
jgi:hypothetical protein